MAAALAALCLAALPLASQAQARYPDKPIRLLVGFPAGTATDTVARALAQRLTETRDWKIVVDNKPGVTGSLAAAEVARAAPDGYTVLVSAAGPLATNPNLYRSVTYDAVRDFTPIALLADISYVIAVGANSPAHSVQDLIAMARAKPAALNYGSLGVGSTQHLIGTTFVTRAGMTMTHVPYKGSADMLTGVVSGDVTFYVDTAVAAPPQVAGGRLKVLGVTSARRVATLPQLATLDEQGLKGFDMPNWLMLLGPANLPAPVLDTLSREVNSLLASDDFRARLAKLGAEPRGGLNTAELRTFLRAEQVKWKAAIDAAGVKPE